MKFSNTTGLQPTNIFVLKNNIIQNLSDRYEYSTTEAL